MRKRPPSARAKSHASRAVRRLPRWRSPVGEGAKRPVIVPFVPKKLREYERKRDFESTPEPAGGVTETADLPRFVIQEHSATRLHWDLRLEHDGVLLSWAVPNGIPQSPDENRKAVHTEDHPLEYLDFHGEIPKGNYGAGTMTIWDHGTYVPEKIEDRKVMAEFHGERVRGRYALFQTGPDPKDWMIHPMDPPGPGREGGGAPRVGPAGGRGGGADAGAGRADARALGRSAGGRGALRLRDQVGRHARDRPLAARADADPRPQPERDHGAVARAAAHEPRAARARGGARRRDRGVRRERQAQLRPTPAAHAPERRVADPAGG